MKPASYPKIKSLLIVCFFCVNSLSFAADVDEENAFEFTLGGGVFYGPEYEGHEDKETKFFPMIGIEYGSFSLGMEGVQYKFYTLDKSSISLGINYDDGRDKSDLPREKRGLGEIDGGIDFSVSGKVSLLDNLSLGLKASKSIEHHQRFKASVSLGSMFPIYQKTILGRLSISSTWNDAELNQLYYGVTNEQSIKSGLAEFNTNSGFKDLKYSVTSIFNFNQHVNSSLSLIYKKLQGDAARSPVIARQDNFSIVQTLSYRF